MDCLAKAFAQFVDFRLIFDHPAPYHVQEIIAQIYKHVSVTEIITDTVSDSPYNWKHIEKVRENYSGVLAYWTGQDQMHAVAYFHKGNLILDDGQYKIPRPPYSIFWIVEPRLTKAPGLWYNGVMKNKPAEREQNA